jgi:hypothetical protein
MVMAITARIAAVITTRVVITREDIMREGTMLADIIAAIGRGEDTTITGVITTGGIITGDIIATGGAIGAIVITGTTCGGRSAGTIAGSITVIAT